VSELVTRDRRHLWHPYAAVNSGPLFEVASVAGPHLVFDDGRELVDGMSSWWAAIHGYRHPVLDAAVRSQLDTFAHVMFGGLTHRPAVELAEVLVRLTPAALTRVFLADSGSVAVEVALKMALQYWQGCRQPQRRRMLALRGGYHGDTAGAMSVSDPAGMHEAFRPHVTQQLFLSRPSARYGQPAAVRDVDELRRMLEQNGQEIAALIVEPVLQGAGGMWMYSADYLRELVALCRQHDVLVIFDEIATGFGRTGRLFAMEHADVAPDILCVGKALTGGYLSLAAALCTDRVADGVCAPGGTPLMHGPTFMANPLACAAAIASVDLLVQSDWQRAIERIERLLRLGLEPCRGLPGVTDVRVLGAVGVVELAQPVDLTIVQPALVDRGVWLRPFGRLLYTMPPFVSTDCDVATITGAMYATAAEALPAPDLS
jgi:adenosylmethionine---8-amino-7-oxononanoate aminotransferase